MIRRISVYAKLIRTISIPVQNARISVPGRTFPKTIARTKGEEIQRFLLVVRIAGISKPAFWNEVERAVEIFLAVVRGPTLTDTMVCFVC